MPTFSLAAVVTVWLGLFCGLAWVSGYTLLQENVEDEYRGRTFASLTVLSRLGLFASLTFFPILSSVYDSTPSTSARPAGFVLSGTRVALWAAGAPGARRRSQHPPPVAAVPAQPAPTPHARAEAEAAAGDRPVHRLRRAWRAPARARRSGWPRSTSASLGLDVLVTREPGGTELGERVRQVLLDPNTGKLDARAEALLFAASRAQTVTSVIRPALADGKIVICDRYVDSSLAYQGWARGLGEQDVLTLNVWATQGLFPDLVVLLHVEPELGLLRSTEAPDRMELEGQDFHAKVSDAYLKIAEEHPERFVVIDADKPPAEVFEGVKEALDRVLKDREDDAPPPERRLRSDRPGSIAPVSAVLDQVPGQDAAMAFLTGAAERPHHAYVSPGPRARASRSRRGRSSPRSCAPDGGCGACRRAGWRSRITTRTCSWWSPRAGTSTWTRSARRSGPPPIAPLPSRAARCS